MNVSGLSLDKAPPIDTPLRFFLAAPVFGVLAGLLLIGYPELLTNRWLPATLAFTHLLTLGVGTMVMLGALFQVLPVASNRAVAGDQAIAPWVHRGMVWGTLTLAAGFLTSRGWLFGLAALLLATGFGLFVSAFGTGLIRARPAGDTTITLRLAALSLVATLVLGGMQLSLHLWPEASLYEPHQTLLHAFVGGFGWVLLLVMAVSFQVIPMFHVAPAFPRWVCRQLTLVIFAANAAVLLAGQPVAAVALPLTLMAAILYASEALKVLITRKRKLVDYTVRFWQLGLSQLIAASLLARGLIVIEGTAWRAQDRGAGPQGPGRQWRGRGVAARRAEQRRHLRPGRLETQWWPVGRSRIPGLLRLLPAGQRVNWRSGERGAGGAVGLSVGAGGGVLCCG